MNRLRSAALAAIALVAFVAVPASAMTWGGEVFGAFSTHSNDDWKDFTQAINQLGGTIDDPTASWGGGLGLRVWPNSSWMVAATWEPIFLTRKESFTGVELNLDASSFQLATGYFFPTTSSAKFGVGAGVAYYSLNGHSPDPTFTSTVDLTGSTIGFHFVGMGEWTVNPGFAITGTAGYRIAKITDTKFNDESARDYFGDPTVPDVKTDYSGLMLRAGVVFYLPHSGQ
jgi:hypothetical protein